MDTYPCDNCLYEYQCNEMCCDECVGDSNVKRKCNRESSETNSGSTGTNK